MKKHLLVFLAGVAAVVVASAPTILATPAVEHFVENHPGVAAFIPLVTGLLASLAKAYSDRSAAPAAPAAPTT